jgi:hypothetical protein
MLPRRFLLKSRRQSFLTVATTASSSLERMISFGPIVRLMTRGWDILARGVVK